MGMLPGSLSGASDMGEEADHVGPGGGWRVGQLFSPEQVKKGKFFLFLRSVPLPQVIFIFILELLPFLLPTP